MTIALDERNEIKKIVRKELRKMVHDMVEEEFRLRMMELRLSLVPEVSDKEQREIEEMFGEPGPDDVAATYTLKVK